MFKRVVIAAIAMAFLAPLAHAAMELKWATVSPAESFVNKGGRHIAEEVKKATNGEVVIHFFDGGQISSSERELVEGVQLGTLEMCFTTAGMMSIYDPKFMLFSLPFLFSSYDEQAEILAGPIGKEFEKIMEAQGMKLLTWSTNGGDRVVTTSRRELNTLEDFKGLKIRCMENPLIIETWKCLGVVGTPMALGETFTGLQQGTIDGQSNNLVHTYNNRYYEVQKFMAYTREFQQLGLILISLDVYNSMKPEVREQFLEAFHRGMKKQREMSDEQEAQALDNMEARGVKVTYPDLEAFKAAVQPVYDNFLPTLDPQLRKWVDEIREYQKRK